MRDKVEPLVFSLNVSLYEKLPEKRYAVQDLRRLPVLSKTPQPSRTQVRKQNPHKDHSPTVKPQNKVKLMDPWYNVTDDQHLQLSDPHPEGLWL